MKLIINIFFKSNQIRKLACSIIIITLQALNYQLFSHNIYIIASYIYDNILISK